MNYKDLKKGDRVEVESFWRGDYLSWEPGTVTGPSFCEKGKKFSPDKRILPGKIIRAHRMDQVRPAPYKSMEHYCEVNGERGFTKGEMRQALGPKFSDKAWRRMVRHSSRCRLSEKDEAPTFDRKRKRWYYFN